MKSVILAAVIATLAASLPIRREVPQEHSHNGIIATVRTSLNLNNPDGIVDPIFGLLGNAAGAAGLGKLTDPDCLQQSTADQAFTNAKAAGDVDGMVAALQFRALERNTGAVGTASVACTSVTAVNPEIAAISQHQDPASTGAAAINKAIVLELAKQIASVGGDPTLALKTGTFAPGTIGDPTAKGNSCDTDEADEGCIFTQNLLVEDATTDEIAAAVAGVTSGGAAEVANPSISTSTAPGTATACSTVTVTMTTTLNAAATTTPAASTTTTSSPAAVTTKAAATTGTNLQTFTGTLGGSLPPAVTAGGSKGFLVNGDEFIQEAGALGRSCDEQHNTCANAANAGGNKTFTVSDCDTQNTQCHAAITA